MKKLLALILPIFIFLTTGCTFANNNQNLSKFNNKKILIAYYSNSGNTKYIAEKIKQEINGDIFEIIPVKPYPKSYTELTEYAKQEKANKVLPKINTTDISNYEIVFVGTPIWWGTMANPVETFLKTNNFEGKTIIPFVTHGGGGGYQVAEDIKNIIPKANVLEQLTIQDRGDSTTNKQIKKWLNNINF